MSRIRRWIVDNAKTTAIAAVAALVASGIVAWAAQTNYLGTVFIADSTTPSQQLKVNSDGSINVDATGGGGGSVTQGTVPWVVAPSKGTGAYSSATIGTSSAQALAASAATVFLDIVNESASATIACNFGSAAVINGAGSITFPPGWHRSWEGSFVPTDAVNCIASAATTPATIGVK